MTSSSSAIEHLRAGIHRRVEQDELGALAEGCRQLLARQPPGRRLETHQLRHAAGAAHDGQIRIVERLDQHDFVARLDQAEQAVAQRLGGARGHQHFALPVDVQPLEAPGVLGDRLAQLGQAHHRRVLIVPLQQIVRRRPTHRLGPLVVGKALAEVDRLMLAGERRHHLEDRGAEAGHQEICRFHKVYCS
jgi:hypothetical protein